MSKKVKQNFNPSITKNPHNLPVGDFEQMNPKWIFSNIDFGGPFGWDTVDRAILIDVILPKMRNFETMKWSDIKGRADHSHPLPVYKMEREAQDRLAELRLDDIEDLQQLNIGGLKRVWGIRNGEVLKILWWDPLHKVYPVSKKNT